MGPESQRGFGARFCYGACFGFGFVASAISLVVMFWVLWCYVGLVSFQVSESQRRALVHYPVTTAKPTPSTTAVPYKDSKNAVLRPGTVDSTSRLTAIQNDTSSALSSSKTKIAPQRGSSRGEAPIGPERRKDSSDSRSDSTKGDFASRDTPPQYVPAKSLKDLNITEAQKDLSASDNKARDRGTNDANPRSDGKLAVILSGNEGPPVIDRYDDDRRSSPPSDESISVRVVSSSAPENRPLYESKDRTSDKPKPEPLDYDIKDDKRGTRRTESVPSRRDDYDDDDRRIRPAVRDEYERPRPSRDDYDTYDKGRIPPRDYVDRDAYDRDRRPIDRSIPVGRSRDEIPPRRIDEDDLAYERRTLRRDIVTSDRDMYDKGRPRTSTSYRGRDAYDDIDADRRYDRRITDEEYDRLYPKGTRRVVDDDDDRRIRERERLPDVRAKGESSVYDRRRDDRYRDSDDDRYRDRLPDDRYRRRPVDDRYRDRTVEDRYRTRVDDDDRYRERVDDRYIDRSLADDRYKDRRLVDDKYVDRRTYDDDDDDERYKDLTVEERKRRRDERYRERTYDDRYRDRPLDDDRYISRPKSEIPPRVADDLDPPKPKSDESRYRDAVTTRRRDDDRTITDLSDRRVPVVEEIAPVRDTKPLPRSPAVRERIDPVIEDRKPIDYDSDRRERVRPYRDDDDLPPRSSSVDDRYRDRDRDRIRDEEYRRRQRPSSYDPRDDDDLVVSRTRDDSYKRVSDDRTDYVETRSRVDPRYDEVDRTRTRNDRYDRDKYSSKGELDVDRYRDRRVDDDKYIRESIPIERRRESVLRDSDKDDFVDTRRPVRKIGDPDYDERVRPIYTDEEERRRIKVRVTKPEDVVLDHRSYTTTDETYSRNLPRADDKLSPVDEADSRYSRRKSDDVVKGSYRDDDRMYEDRRKDTLDDDQYRDRPKGDYGRGRPRTRSDSDYDRGSDTRSYDRTDTRYLTDDVRSKDVPPKAYDDYVPGTRDRRRDNVTKSRVLNTQREDRRDVELEPSRGVPDRSSANRPYSRDTYSPSRPVDDRRYTEEPRTLSRRDIIDDRDPYSKGFVNSKEEVTSSSIVRDRILPNIREKRYQDQLSSSRNRDDSASYDASPSVRPLTPKEIIEAAYRHSEVPDRPGEVIYPVFDPRVNNMTSPEIIRPSERRGTIITAKRKKK